MKISREKKSLLTIVEKSRLVINFIKLKNMKKLLGLVVMVMRYHLWRVVRMLMRIRIWGMIKSLRARMILTRKSESIGQEWDMGIKCAIIATREARSNTLAAS